MLQLQNVIGDKIWKLRTGSDIIGQGTAVGQVHLIHFFHKGGFNWKKQWISTTHAPEEFLKEIDNSEWSKELHWSLAFTLYEQGQNPTAIWTKSFILDIEILV